MLESGPKLLRIIGKRLKSGMYSKLADRGVDPHTLLTFAQISLYYSQYSLMEVLEKIDSGKQVDIPNSIQTDAVTSDGRVRVGWLSRANEAVLSRTEDFVEIVNKHEVDLATRLLIRPLDDTACKTSSNYVDIRKACHYSDCADPFMADAARVEFDSVSLSPWLNLQNLPKLKPKLQIIGIFIARQGSQCKPLTSTAQLQAWFCRSDPC